MPPRSNPVDRFRRIVERTTPEDATVVVVTRGDAELLKLGGRRGWHFPQRTDGVYAGYYPEDRASAIAHLEALRTKGGEFLAFPPSATWWLEHYDDFAQHLESAYECVVRADKDGAIYALVEGRALPPQAARNGGRRRRRAARAPE